MAEKTGNAPIRILAVDDEKSIRRLLQKELSAPSRSVTTAESAGEALSRIDAQAFDVIILDICLPDGNGMELMERCFAKVPDVEVILITGHGDIDIAVEAMKMGAYDFITKPFNLDQLEVVVEKAFQRVLLKRENRLLRHTRQAAAPARLIGHSRPMEEVRFLVGKVAPTHVPVLITGESGCGKNVVAQLLHAQSLRADSPLIIKNCGTLEKSLMRSELFGHARGAFTGADEAREGLLASADKGTLFLDEIGELSHEVQAALLRVLENQTYRRVGDKGERKVDIRFFFATNRNLREAVAEGRFSDALYHRINVFNIPLVPLADRMEDVPALIEHFLGRLGSGGEYRVSREAMHCLLSYRWPGNVRELQNVMERGIILSENGLITERALPRELVDAAGEQPAAGPLLSLKELERQHIRRVLDFVSGNRQKAAEILGIGRKTLYRKLQQEDSGD